MNYQQFCAEHYKEGGSPSKAFSRPVIARFLKIYSHLTLEDLTGTMVTRLRVQMIDWANEGSKWYAEQPLPVEKIELPDWVIR